MTLGPVEYVVVAFPGNKFTGKVAPALADLVESGTIRIMDLAFVTKDADGNVLGFELTDLDDDEARAFDGIGGDGADLISEEDLHAIGEELEPNNSAAMLVSGERVGDQVRRRRSRGRRRAPRPRPHPARGAAGRRRLGRGGEQGGFRIMMMRRRGPGLVRGVARTAVVAGTATAVSGRVARRQARKFEEKDQSAYDEQQQQQQYAEPPPDQQQYVQQEPQYVQAAPEPAPSQIDDDAAEIRKLASLRDQGLLTEEEFSAKKKQILGI